MNAMLLLLLLVWNFLVSWLNAWSVGRSWAETKAMGGWPRFMAWCSAVMSASGFTWCYLVLFCLIGGAIPGKYHLPDRYASAVFALGYLMIIIPVLGSGVAMTIQSWSYFWKERTFGSGAVAGYNTFAQIYNTYEAVHAIPECLSLLKDVWSTEDSDDAGKQLLFALLITAAILCLIGGIVTTTVIVRTTARGVAEAELKRTRIAKTEVIREGYGGGSSSRWGA
jgi:hypothetical protein